MQWQVTRIYTCITGLFILLTSRESWEEWHKKRENIKRSWHSEVSFESRTQARLNGGLFDSHMRTLSLILHFIFCIYICVPVAVYCLKCTFCENVLLFSKLSSAFVCSYRDCHVIFFPDVHAVYFMRHAHFPEADGVISVVSTIVISELINFNKS
jgi:hypothetical protein